MDHDGIRALVALMEECGLAELELGEGPGRVRLVRAGAGPVLAALGARGRLRDAARGILCCKYGVHLLHYAFLPCDACCVR